MRDLALCRDRIFTQAHRVNARLSAIRLELLLHLHKLLRDIRVRRRASIHIRLLRLLLMMVLMMMGGVISTREQDFERVALFDESAHLDVVCLALRLELLLQRSNSLVRLAHRLALLFLERLAVLAFLCFHLGAHFAHDAQQFLVLRLQRGEVAEEYEVVRDHFVNVVRWRAAHFGFEFLVGGECRVLATGYFFEERLDLTTEIVQLLLD